MNKVHKGMVIDLSGSGISHVSDIPDMDKPGCNMDKCGLGREVQVPVKLIVGDTVHDASCWMCFGCYSKFMS
jgi:hypothetical protein